MDLQMKECTRDNLCVDCDNDHCIFQGKKESDCPKWRCDMPKGTECERCEFIDEFILEMRKGKNEDSN